MIWPYYMHHVRQGSESLAVEAHGLGGEASLGKQAGLEGAQVPHWRVPTQKKLFYVNKLLNVSNKVLTL